MDVQSVIDKIGLPGASFYRVSGGDINSCWRLQTANTGYFLKINDATSYPGMFRKEAGGLEALRKNSSFTVPVVVKEGVSGEHQYLLLEWLEEDITDHLQEAGQKLAEMHLQQQEWFGWKEDNYIGSLQQVNTRKDNWHSFYGECRILPMVKILFDKNLISLADLDRSEKFCLRLNKIFPSEPASFLHGDLWGGNYMNTINGPSIFDPAVYYGHREMDIGMTKLFGGFDQRFYEAYEQVYPLEKGWQDRLPYAQLYPLLMHAVLFGGSYIERAMNIMKGI